MIFLTELSAMNWKYNHRIDKRLDDWTASVSDCQKYWENFINPNKFNQPFWQIKLVQLDGTTQWIVCVLGLLENRQVVFLSFLCCITTTLKCEKNSFNNRGMITKQGEGPWFAISPDSIRIWLIVEVWSPNRERDSSIRILLDFPSGFGIRCY